MQVKVIKNSTVSKDNYRFINGFKGMEFCKKEDLVVNADMSARGFDIIEVEGNKSKKTGSNKSAYFVHPDLPYVYAECYFRNVDRYAQLIVSKKLFDDYLSRKAIIINLKMGRYTPCITHIDKVDLHRLVGNTKIADHITGSYNLLIEENIREADSLHNSKNKEQVGVVKDIATGKFIVRLHMNKRLVSDEDMKDLEDMNYDITDTGIVNVYKDFDTKVEALKALRMLEERLYKDFAYSPINDMRGRFDLKFQQLILGTVTEDDVIKTVLKEYAHDAYSVHRYNLIPLCEKYGIPYNEGITLPNGDLVNE